jgi:hypothetical protein
MPEEDTGVTVHVGVRTGHLAVFLQNARHDGINRVHDLEQFVIRHVLEREFALARLTNHQGRFCAKRRVGLPGKFRNRFLVDRFALRVKFGFELMNPFEHFLIGESVLEGTGERIKARPRTPIRGPPAWIPPSGWYAQTHCPSCRCHRRCRLCALHERVGALYERRGLSLFYSIFTTSKFHTFRFHLVLFLPLDYIRTSLYTLVQNICWNFFQQFRITMH